MPSGLVLLLWYEPLQKFMHLKVSALISLFFFLRCVKQILLRFQFIFFLFKPVQHIAVSLPDPLVIFELLVLVTDELPQLCVGVRECQPRRDDDPQTKQQLKFDIIELNGSTNPNSGVCSLVSFAAWHFTVHYITVS